MEAVLLVAVAALLVIAARSLPKGPRPGIGKSTLAEAAAQLRASGKADRHLVEAARTLVEERMTYCRRNSFDPPPRAFERGYGFCTQHAYALADLLRRLGIRAQEVFAFQNRFPDGTVGGHTWVRVTLNGEEWDIDSLFFDTETGQVTFTPLSKVRNHVPLFRRVTAWGEAAVNARRYYRTGKDM
jgi:transglutaminase-like putative cysteine protease